MRNGFRIWDGGSYVLLRSFSSFGEGVVSGIEVFAFLRVQAECREIRLGGGTIEKERDVGLECMR